MRRKRLYVYTAASGLAAAATVVAITSQSATATVPGMTSDFMPATGSVVATLIDGTPLRQANWVNFQRYVAGCMDAKGFTYRIPNGPPESVSPTTLPSASTAAASGFKAVTSVTYTMATGSAASQGRVASSAPAFYKALRGVDMPQPISSQKLATYDFTAYDGVNSDRFGTTASATGGCEAAGRQAVSEPAGDAYDELYLASAPIADILNSDGFLAVQDAWSACMNASSFAYYDLASPSMDMLSTAGALKASGATAAQLQTAADREKQVAQVTASCATSSGMSGYLATTVDPQWNQFVQANLDLVKRAGGMTEATHPGAGTFGGQNA